MDDYVKYRMDTAKERLVAASSLIDAGCYKDSINRSYYAIFSATRALLANERIDFSKHSGVIGYFRRNYIKTGLLDVKYSDYIGKAFQYRTDCDYEDFFIVDRADAELQYQHALEFYEAIENYLNMETE